MLKPLNVSADAPWRERFEAARIISSEIATRNPNRGVVTTNKDGVYQLYAWDVPTGELTQMTDYPTGKRGGFISADGERIYYLHDQGGDEIGHYHAKTINTGEAVDISPDMPPYASHYFTECFSGNYYGFQVANQYGFFIYVIDNVKGGEPLFRYESQALSLGPLLSYDGEIAVIATTEKAKTLHYNLEAYDVKTGEKLGELWDGEGTSIQPIGFARRAADMRFLAISNATGYNRPFIWNTRTNERTELPIDELEGDVTAWDWSEDGQYILLRQMYMAENKLWLYNTQTKEVTALNHPSGTYSHAYFTPQGTIYAHISDATNPERIIELGGLTGELKGVVLDASKDQGGIRPRSVTFTSANGVPIQAWLYTPEGEGPFPTIVHTHGGPTAVTTENFSPDTQTWLDHGFAFFSINYQGSVTFGKDFQDAIIGNLGDLEVQDIEAGAHWLIDQGIADPDMLLITGRSYGGYLTLQTVGKVPDLWAGGMAGVAIADWALMYEDQAETLRGYQRALFGGTPQEKPEAHQKSSPITYAERVKAPLLIIQGRNDTRCPERQMLKYLDKMDGLGKQVDVDWYEAGHASMATDEQIRQMELMLRFAYRVLG
ncbi:S9 family peptidase [Phototrophicus methaneseepsis]|uniref:S9 family peptidase n=1 Tax=Phototrophicus methaneseepsis TaxID=2710758 RepID=A0A7S8E9H2_9CHLR|nr:prolyl oligopeptidase family serine peptidase [Phototrophicus methaneseepsis]QPC82851.1 S9 family peptidase [Phototrophicus methaneseepsis]